MCFLLPSTADFWVLLSLDIDLSFPGVFQEWVHIWRWKERYLSIYCEHMHVFVLLLVTCTKVKAKRSFNHICMFGVSNIFLKKLILLFISYALNWSKVTVGTFIILQKISILNNCFLFIQESRKKKHITASVKILSSFLFSTLIIIKMFLEWQISIIEL